VCAQQPPVPIARLVVPADPGTLALCRHALVGALDTVRVADEVVEDLKLVLSEVCMNAIGHGYRGGPGTIEIEFRISDREFEVAVRDRGAGAAAGRAVAGTGSSVLESLTSRHAIDHPAGGGTIVTFAHAV
jgi:serine/threonine-protein kinase RsbW